ncbi:hypothetical protein DH2020_017149 [Rehmannia glutinosa]|uniref:Uncharacterized protein n=1 Tax=Rehmannia glutinosa TaxID=99300 RepID=A0ABR0WTJ2_REHGL
MFGFTVKARQDGPGSPRAAISPRSDVGEIDTRAPFQSVKAAVSLFGEVGSPRSLPVTKKSKAEERVLEKETQHHMMLRELDYYKDQLKNAEIAKAQALRELQRANRTLQELTNKLETLSESKQASIKATEAAKIRAKELEEQQSIRAQLGNDAWKLDLESERERYKASTGELIAGKQELANLRQDFDAALESKLAVFQKAEDAQHTAQMNQERQSQLAKEVEALRQTLGELNLTARQAEEEHLKFIAEKEDLLLTRKSAKQEAEKEIERLRGEYVPKGTLQEKMEETMEAIKVLQEQLKEIQASDMYSLKTTVSELENAKNALREAVAEENSLRSSIDSLKQQLQEVKTELSELEQKALKAESTVDQMQAELEKKKTELEAAMTGSASGMQASLDKISAETDNARREAEESKKKAELLKREAEESRLAAKEAEEKLKIALEEAEAAKEAEKTANDQIYNYPKSEAAESKDSESVRKIRLSVEEFESMNKKIEGFRNQADLKVATAMAQVETITASEKGISEKLEEILKQNEAIQSEIKDALKRAEMAEAAKRIVENELQKWRQNEVGKPSKKSEAK